MRLRGKNVLITGAAGLLGKQHALACVSEGANVLLIDKVDITIENLFPDLDKSFFKKIIYRQCDITSEKEVIDSVSEFTNRFGILNCLVNNAAINPKIEETTTGNDRKNFYNDANWDNEINVGLRGGILCSKIIGEELIARKEKGSIVNISSHFGIIAPNQNIYKNLSFVNNVSDYEWIKPISYSVIKHGVNGMTKYLAALWGKYQIRVNTISPGGVKNLNDDEFNERYSKTVPLGRMADPEDFRGALIYLLSDESSYTTGLNLIVDGGRTIW